MINTFPVAVSKSRQQTLIDEVTTIYFIDDCLFKRVVDVTSVQHIRVIERCVAQTLNLYT